MFIRRVLPIESPSTLNWKFSNSYVTKLNRPLKYNPFTISREISQEQSYITFLISNFPYMFFNFRQSMSTIGYSVAGAFHNVWTSFGIFHVKSFAFSALAAAAAGISASGRTSL